MRDIIYSHFEMRVGIRLIEYYLPSSCLYNICIFYCHTVQMKIFCKGHAFIANLQVFLFRTLRMEKQSVCIEILTPIAIKKLLLHANCFVFLMVMAKRAVVQFFYGKCYEAFWAEHELWCASNDERNNQFKKKAVDRRGGCEQKEWKYGILTCFFSK